MTEDSEFESCVRRSWRRLVTVALPAAGVERGWAVATPEAFARILLDHVCDGPWEREVGGAGVGTVELVLAIEAGERVLSGAADLPEMNRRSLAARAAPLSDEEVAALLLEDGVCSDMQAAAAGLAAADTVARICAAAARRRGGARRGDRH